MNEEEIRRKDRRETGCLIAVLLTLGLVFLGPELYPKKKAVEIRVYGKIEQPLLTETSFELAVWHHFPGNLKNGRLQISIQGKSILEEQHLMVHSFEIWEPNQLNSIPVSCPLRNYDPAEPINVEVFITTANARDTLIRFVWQKNRWVQ